MASELRISVIKGKDAPRYSMSVLELTLNRAVITENGMESNRPLVDLQLTDKDGNNYFAMVSGGLIAMLGDKVKEINHANGGQDYSHNTFQK